MDLQNLSWLFWETIYLHLVIIASRERRKANKTSTSYNEEQEMEREREERKILRMPTRLELNWKYIVGMKNHEK